MDIMKKPYPDLTNREKRKIHFEHLMTHSGCTLDCPLAIDKGEFLICAATWADPFSMEFDNLMVEVKE